MEKAASQNSKVCKHFLAVYIVYQHFFLRSQLHHVALDLVHQRISKNSNTVWNFNSRTVSPVYENINDLRKCFDEL